MKHIVLHKLYLSLAFFLLVTLAGVSLLALRSHVLAVQNSAPSGLSPQDLRRTYDTSPLQQKGCLDTGGCLGDGQTIALIEIDGYNPQDIATYYQTYHLGTPHIHDVLLDGASGLPGKYSGETELDIEMVAAIAPHAQQIVYEAPNNVGNEIDLYNRIVTDKTAQIVSISEGFCERDLDRDMNKLDAIFRQGATQGISFFAASGDRGAYNCGIPIIPTPIIPTPMPVPGPVPTPPPGLAVNFPASDPYVTGVGGTYVSGIDLTDVSTAWEGSGGGLSGKYPRPWWQQGPGVQNQYSNGQREVPDIAANAGNAGTPVAFYCTVAADPVCNPDDGWGKIGGTSVAAPLCAAMIALLNQYRHWEWGVPPLGFVNPLLYTLANNAQTYPYPPFHDATVGNNGYYPATPGYDMVTGLGSMDVYNIARDLDVGA